MIVDGFEAICWRGLAAELAVDERQGQQQNRVFLPVVGFLLAPVGYQPQPQESNPFNADSVIQSSFILIETWARHSVFALFIYKSIAMSYNVTILS